MARIRDTRKSTTMQSHSQRSNAGKLISEDLVIARNEVLSEEATQARCPSTRENIFHCESHISDQVHVESNNLYTFLFDCRYLISLAYRVARGREGTKNDHEMCAWVARIRSLYLI